MHPPCELMVKEFLPAMRGLVAHKLSARGLSQSKISGMIGITQAAVSQYLSRSEEYYLGRARGLGIPDPDSARYVVTLCEDLSQGQVPSVYTLYSIWRRLLGEGLMCDAHRRDSPLPISCDMCMKIIPSAKVGHGREEIIYEMERAVRMLEGSPLFPLIMPQVSVNLVTSTQDARNEGDVAAIPGRIVKVRGMAKSILRPEFGSSHHMARVLLAARSIDATVRSAINVMYDHKMDRILRSVGIRPKETPGVRGSNGDPALDAILSSLTGLKKAPSAIVEKGGQGIEPILYLFGKNPGEIVEKSLQIANLYARGVESRVPHP